MPRSGAESSFVAPRTAYTARDWTILLVAAAAMVGTLPGRTQGLGLITEPLLADLGIDRLSYARLNFWATIAGSVFAVGGGRVIDRFGTRRVLAAVALVLAAAVAAMSRATTIWQLAVLVTLTRGFGQSALSVVSLTIVGRWFVRGIDGAMAIYSVVMSIGFMLAFPAVGAIVQARGWRVAWLTVAIALGGALVPMALLLAVPRSAGDVHSAAAAGDAEGLSWLAALATPAFWVFAIGTALYGLVASGIGLFNESILLERGFGPDIYYQTLVVTALTALAGNFLGGWLARTVPLGILMAVALFVLALGLVALPAVRSLGQVYAWAVAMGLGGGLVMVLFFSVWPRVYGRRSLGRIQGTAQALTVLASATGPLLLAGAVEATGSYARAFHWLAAAVAAAGAMALVVRVPEA